MTSTAPTTQPNQQSPQVKLLSPIKLLEQLSTINNREHTPIPTKSQLFFITGMQNLDKNMKSAGEKLTASVAEAEKSKEEEQLAVSYLGLGYFYYLKQEVDKTLQLYQASLEIWNGIHKDNQLKLTELLLDLSKLYELQNNKSDFEQTITRCNEIYKKNGKDDKIIKLN
ncbi:hypothetical protein DLAC_06603 [Tieghemostelium lacteum]|uniref:Tetratricopeptide repeat protein n=1 Tax=Tieghemostelium lacteum TaxID=361077 RepID=A0A151ZFC0_TIELA|nr:hypothetical protein DLAC_06603 [Tieghemostelium lacteum]|eukprot:KYQ92609.1 hypothetical protein DLAC_06603 [Tieghemostelium lacteum]